MGRLRIIFLLGLGLAVLTAAPAGAAMESGDCLLCHAEAAEVGDDMTIDPLLFDHTAHGELGCLSCHESVTETHPDDGLEPSKTGCGDCHQDISEEYARSGHAQSASCGDCHNPHQVRGAAEVSGQDLNRSCAACHPPGEMASTHAVWLPQPELHMEMLPCISCHTGSADNIITLYITTRPTEPGSGLPVRGYPFVLAEHRTLKSRTGENEVRTLVDTDQDGIISLAELRQFNSRADLGDLRLKGMLTPEVATHSLQILDNRWDCTSCHASGPGALQTSFLALPRPDGTFQRFPVEKGAILDLLNGTPDFYMLGASRNSILDLIGLLILAGGLIMPVGHGALRFLTRRNRR